MNKGLETLKELKEACETHMGRMVYILQEDKFETIEKELKELEERREMMKRFNDACVPTILDNETEKKLKALEIIKDKRVNCFDVIDSVDYKHYLVLMEEYHKSWRLTKQEYKLLKEVLEDE